MSSEITKEMWDELNEKYQRLKSSEELYRVAIGLTSHIISVVDLQTHTTYQVHNEGKWSTLTSAMPNAPESIIETGIIHPDDQEEFRRYYRDMYSGVEETGCIIRSKDDERGWLWFQVFSKTVYDKDGTPLRAICFSDDITDKKNAELHYMQYRDVVASDADSMWEANLTQDSMLSEDAYFDKLFGHHENQTYTEVTEIGASFIPDEDVRAYVIETMGREGLLKAFNEATREVSVDYETDFNDGKGMRWMHVTAHIMANIKGDIVAIICAKDTTAFRVEMEKLEKKAEHDELTGLANRFALKTQVDKFMINMPDGQHGFMIFDVDEFKICNDTYGHAYGDDILCIIADTMRETFRATDVLCRLGGDEFVVFMVSAGDPSNIKNKGKALMDNLKKVSEEKNLKFPIKISAGATISKPGESFKEVYLRMDSALYTSKKKGKNRLTFV